MASCSLPVQTRVPLLTGAAQIFHLVFKLSCQSPFLTEVGRLDAFQKCFAGMKISQRDRYSKKKKYIYRVYFIQFALGICQANITQNF